MKKHQFINELTTALHPVDAQTRAEIIADINEHFEEGISRGQTEEEICKNLGQPGQIADQVVEEYKTHYGSRSNTNETIDKIGDLVGEIVGNLGNIGQEIGKVCAASLPELGSLWEATRVRGGYEINIDKSFTDVRSLDLSLSVCGIKIMPAAQGESARVVIQGQSRHNNFHVENQGGCLVVTEKHPVFRIDLFGFKTNLTATIYLPASFDGEIRGRASAGSITVTDVRGNLQLKASAGDVMVNNHVGHNAYIRSSAGSVHMLGCAIVNVDSKSSAGDVVLEGQETGNLSLDSSAGEVKVLVDKLGGETQISSSAGSVRLQAREVYGNITAKSSAGAVIMRLPKDVNCRIDAKKPSIGSVENYLTGNPQSPYVLRVVTSVGSVKLMAL
ncbi:MAG: DUF1700 domain-containing protein [Defluviitaleaceae bacterium]|nr:DUF1700 domain-containing protein [Defluviitaleaceae bacterium]